MNPQTGAPRKLGTPPGGAADGAAGGAPLPPPQARPIGVTMIGATTAPSEPPLYATATPRPRSSGASVCVATRRPPGKVAPSPNPSAARAKAKPTTVAAKAWATDAQDQRTIASA